MLYYVVSYCTKDTYNRYNMHQYHEKTTNYLTVSNFHIDYKPVLYAKKSLRKTEKALQKSELFIM